MRTTAFVFSAVLVSLLAVSRSEVITDPEYEITPYSIIDPIIKTILEVMRPKLKDLKVDDINEQVKSPGLNATIKATDILIKNADTFEIKNLKSNIVPLKLTNLTLTWAQILGSASYDVDANVAIPQINSPVRLYGKGDARAALKGVFLTVGANMEMKGKIVQVKPKGLFGFDIRINSATVSLSSLMGNSELGKAVGEFIGKIIPDLVNTLKNPIFDAFHDTLVNVINDVLKNYGTILSDEEVEIPELSFEASSEELSEDGLTSNEEFESFFGESLDFEETEFDSEA